MTAEQTAAFLLFAVVVSGTPGPSNLILASTGVAAGVRRGLPALFGQVSGMGCMLLVIGIGLGSLILERPLVLSVLKWLGIGFLLWLSWKIATSGRHAQAMDETRLGFWQLAAFQWVNPKSWIVCASAIGTYLPATDGSTIGRSAVIALLFMLVALPCCAVWLVAGASLQRVLRGERAARVFNIAMGGL
ncbi:MAG TPA: LysE family translocator, partial [Nitrolancea sp.]|nr:LysE family translocator [Nitrolancea sp.]